MTLDAQAYKAKVYRLFTFPYLFNSLISKRRQMYAMAALFFVEM